MVSDYFSFVMDPVKRNVHIVPDRMNSFTCLSAITLSQVIVSPEHFNLQRSQTENDPPAIAPQQRFPGHEVSFLSAINQWHNTLSPSPLVRLRWIYACRRPHYVHGVNKACLSQPMCELCWASTMSILLTLHCRLQIQLLFYTYVHPLRRKWFLNRIGVMR